MALFTDRKNYARFTVAFKNNFIVIFGVFSMKKVKVAIGLLAVAMAIMVQQLDGVSYSSNNSFFKRALVSCQAKMAFLQAGYEYTQEEKNNAREEIALLEGQQAAIWKQYNEINARQDLSTQEKDEHVHSVVSSMYRLNEDIKELQLITGDAWSDDRKRAWGFVALIAAGFVTYKFFGPSIIAFATKNGKNSDKLSAKQEEQNRLLREQEKQQKKINNELIVENRIKEAIAKEKAKQEEDKVKQLKAQKEEQERVEENAKKEARQLEDKKENLRKIEEDVQKRAENIVKIKEQKRQAEAEKAEKMRRVEAEKAEKLAREELYIINNNNVVDARKRVNDLMKEIKKINDSHKDDGAVDQDSDSKRQLLEGQLKQAGDNLQNCIFKEKAIRYDDEQRLKKLAEQRKQDLRDWVLKEGAKFIISTFNMSVKAVKIIAQFAQDGFILLKDRSCLSKEDQETIVRGLY